MATLSGREPEEVSVATIEAFFDHLKEDSATRRHHSPYIVEGSLEVLIAEMRDALLQIQMGRKKLPEENRMSNAIKKGMKRASAEEQRADAEAGRALYEKKRLERIAKKEAEAAEAAKTQP